VQLLQRVRLNKTNFLIHLLIFLAGVQQFIASTWNVDPYHEGALFPTAVGIAEGRSVFAEVSQQYGFLGPLLVSLPLEIFGNYLVVQRIFGALLMILIAWLMYLNMTRLVTPLTAKYFVILWLGISPIWSWPFSTPALSGGYWPNHLGVALTLFSCFVILKYKTNLVYFVAGLTMFLSSQSRAEFYFVWLFVTIAIVTRSDTKRLSWLAGSLLSIVLISIYLFVNDSTKDWYDQTLRVWTMDPPGVPIIGPNFFIFNIMNFLGVTCVGFLIIAISYVLQVKYRAPQVLVLATMVMGLVLVLLLHDLVNTNLYFRSYSFDDLINYLMKNSLFSYVNVTITVLAGILFLQFYKFRLSIIKRISTARLPSVIFGFASIGSLSLFHNFNPDYSHMVWPIFVLTLVSAIGHLNSQISQIFPLAVFKLVTLSLFSVSIVVFLAHFNEQRYAYQAPLLKGLYGNSQEQVTSIDSDLKLVSENVVAGQMLMNCQTGLLTVNERGFLGSDKWTWNQQPSEMLLNRLDRLKLGQTMLSCNMNQLDTSRVASLVKEGKLTITARGSNFLIYKVTESLR
jgi:hypothetical protein